MDAIVAELDTAARRYTRTQTSVWTPAVRGLYEIYPGGTGYVLTYYPPGDRAPVRTETATAAETVRTIRFADYAIG